MYLPFFLRLLWTKVLKTVLHFSCMEPKFDSKQDSKKTFPLLSEITNKLLNIKNWFQKIVSTLYSNVRHRTETCYPFYDIRIALICNEWHIVRWQYYHSLTPLLVRFVTAGYAVRPTFKFAIHIDGFHGPNIISDSYFPVKTWQTSAKYIPLLGMLTMGYFKSRVREFMRWEWKK